MWGDIVPSVSVIVPVFNGAEFLRPCIDSILAQTFRDLEIILVDDGSTDDSPLICDSYASQDKRVISIHQINAGAAAARNHGLAVASGKYVTFVDCDDWIDNDMYEHMVITAETKKCDLVICDCIKEFGTDRQLYTHDFPGGYFDRNTMVLRYFPQLLMPDTMEYPITISNCLLLIGRSVIIENNLSFPDGMRFSEDLLFGSEVGYFSQSMTYLKGYAPYHYRQNPHSVTRTSFSDKWPLLLELYRRIKQSFQHKRDFDFAPPIHRCMLFFVYMSMNHRLSAKVSIAQFFRDASVVLDNVEVRQALKSIRVCRLQISWKLKAITLIYKIKLLRPALLLLRNRC